MATTTIIAIEIATSVLAADGRDRRATAACASRDGRSLVGHVVILPPGRWRSPQDEAHWRSILDWRDTVADTYRQRIYLAMTNPRFGARMSNPEYRARVEREHKQLCERIEAAARSHLEQGYVPDSGAWDAGFELEWVADDAG